MELLYALSNAPSKSGFGSGLTLAPTTAFAPKEPPPKAVPNWMTAEQGLGPTQFMVPSFEENAYTLPAVESTTGPTKSPVPWSICPDLVTAPDAWLTR